MRKSWVDAQDTLTVAVRGIQAGGYGISHCLDRDPVELVPEPDNAYDPHAIRVVSASGGMLGYVPADYSVAMNAADWTAVIAAVLPHPKTGSAGGAATHADSSGDGRGRQRRDSGSVRVGRQRSSERRRYR